MDSHSAGRDGHGGERRQHSGSSEGGPRREAHRGHKRQRHAGLAPRPCEGGDPWESALVRSTQELTRLGQRLAAASQAYDKACSDREDGLAALEDEMRARRDALSVDVIEAEDARLKAERMLDAERTKHAQLKAARRAPARKRGVEGRGAPARKRDLEGRGEEKGDGDSAAAKRARDEQEKGDGDSAAKRARDERRHHADEAALACSPSASKTKRRCVPGSGFKEAASAEVVEIKRGGRSQKVRDVVAEDDGSLLVATLSGHVCRVRRDASTDDEDGDEKRGTRLLDASPLAWVGPQDARGGTLMATARHGADVALAFAAPTAKERSGGLAVLDLATGARSECLGKESFRSGVASVDWISRGSLVFGGVNHEVVVARRPTAASTSSSSSTPFETHILGAVHTARVGCVAALDGGDAAISGGSDCRVALWDLRTGACTGCPELYGPVADRRRKYHALRAVPDAPKIVALASAPSSLERETCYKVDFLDSRCRRVLPGLECPAQKYSEFCEPRFSSDGRFVSLGSLDGTVKLWDTRRLAGRPLDVHAVPHGSVPVGAGLPSEVAHATLLHHTPGSLTFVATCASKLVVRRWTPDVVSPPPRPRAKTQ